MANNIKLDNYIIVDVGANLTNKKFARDLDAVIQRQVKYIYKYGFLKEFIRIIFRNGFSWCIKNLLKVKNNHMID